ncbi:MAG: UDP-glucose 4-epimerase GalE [Bacteroidales bacterium]|nr:UDP-glucose 4-epimerase GalE [Bacteroidales bacterium]MBO7184029.1 UDP-glucose 4-epimerase GalE [Bacteroidales bacterium]MBO7232596.1 UDP-glucose 4-epimerase GalE [Bacteroidales bacterium]MBQ2446961.1 UDP-glucose 4-epimerase GalE [Bacteroidales bacterium]MBQ5605060.1 UDP-glucose 4-epimerase GalE [Bacteroidales bacterium]
MATKILVTGGTGYIGSHTTVELQQAGYEVVIVDNLSNSNIKVLDGIQAITGIRPAFEEVDCTDKPALKAVFEKYPGIKAIINFAASKAVGESVQKPLLYYRNNLDTLINLLELMPEFGVEGFVFSSSCTVYGQPEVLPVTEDTPRQTATSPYGNTKKICEDIITDAVHADAPYKAILLRYFNPIGAHPSAKIGELPLGVPQNLIPFVTQTAAGIREQLSVFGDDYNTPDGSCIRDYINVVDLAKAHVVAVERMLSGKSLENVEVFNVGTGRGLSVLEIVETFQKVTGVKLNYKIVGRREGDIEQVWADPTKANQVLGWKAEASVEETLLSAWRWQESLAK